LLTDKELSNFLRERVPPHFNFGNKAVAYTWQPEALAQELRLWLQGKMRVHGQR
jgi:hypothetical protein